MTSKARTAILWLMAPVALAAWLAATPPAPAEAAVPKRFYGIAPQTTITATDARRMRRGGIDSVRIPVQWSAVQPTARSGFNWDVLDRNVRVAARARLEVFPFLYESPGWLAGRPTNLPVRTRRQRRAWRRFVGAAVRRYRPRGEFWRAQPENVPRIPIRRWQIWNEENFFYFTTPASPKLYARLLEISGRNIKRLDRGASVVVGGLFARPPQGPPRGMDANRFMRVLYSVRGIKRWFDGVAIHPYARNARVLARYVRSLRAVMRRNGDRRGELYVTEMGWGSQRNSPTSFEVGPRGQARELRRAYRFFKANHGALNLKRVYWFTWKDVRSSPCTFCDSTGLFHAGRRLKPKRAWFSFVRVTGGRAR